jgi:hypothetical protein
LTVNEITDQLLKIANNLTTTHLSESQSNNDHLNAIVDDFYHDNNNDDEDFLGIQSQDSFAPWVKSSIHDSYSRHQTVTQSQSLPGSSHRSVPVVPLTSDDIIVEKMHIHYGLKGENPVNRLRFFPKEVIERDHRTHMAMPMKESAYETLLPRVFEELAVRVFCRDKGKTALLADAYKLWCREYNNSATPFPTLSQV